jgi:hypothetical protein
MTNVDAHSIVYPWTTDHAAAVDAILLPWAKANHLHVLTQHQEAEIRSLPVVDDSGDTYDLAVTEPDAAGDLTVTARLRTRRSKRVWHRERPRFVAARTVPIAMLAEGLDERSRRFCVG